MLLAACLFTGLAAQATPEATQALPQAGTTEEGATSTLESGSPAAGAASLDAPAQTAAQPAPLPDTAPAPAKGLASWYGRNFHGRRTASGERFNMYALTAAHQTLPLMSYVRVRNPDNGKSIVVRITDRGPHHPNRMIDLSYGAAHELGIQSLAEVELEPVERADYEAQIDDDELARDLRQASYINPSPQRSPVRKPAPRPAAKAKRPAPKPPKR